jgi:hypothetical protein
MHQNSSPSGIRFNAPHATQFLVTSDVPAKDHLLGAVPPESSGFRRGFVAVKKINGLDQLSGWRMTTGKGSSAILSQSGLD